MTARLPATRGRLCDCACVIYCCRGTIILFRRSAPINHRWAARSLSAVSNLFPPFSPLEVTERRWLRSPVLDTRRFALNRIGSRRLINFVYCILRTPRGCPDKHESYGKLKLCAMTDRTKYSAVVSRTGKRFLKGAAKDRWLIKAESKASRICTCSD